MANKGQKFKKYPPEFKKQVVDEYNNGMGGTITLAKKYGISSHTIDTWIYKEKQGKSVLIDYKKGNSGRTKTKNLTLEDYKERYEILKKYQAFLKARHVKK